MNRERRKEREEEEKINVKRRQDGERGRKKRKKKERERWTNNHIKELIIFKIFLFSFYNRTVSKKNNHFLNLRHCWVVFRLSSLRITFKCTNKMKRIASTVTSTSAATIPSLDGNKKRRRTDDDDDDIETIVPISRATTDEAENSSSPLFLLRVLPFIIGSCYLCK